MQQLEYLNQRTKEIRLKLKKQTSEHKRIFARGVLFALSDIANRLEKGTWEIVPVTIFSLGKINGKPFSLGRLNDELEKVK